MLIELRKNIKFSLRGERGIKGQIFPFLVLIMVIMIVAVMAFVNVAQVNTQKLATMNAADAAALSGAAQLATTANQIAEMNSGPGGLFQSYWKAVGILAGLSAYPWGYAPTGVNSRFLYYMKIAIGNLRTYLSLLSAGIAGVQGAGAQATVAAFNNIPIEEAQQRVGSVRGEPKVPSRFSDFLKNTNFYTKDRIKEYPYYWSSYYYNITEDKQMLRQQRDYVKVKVRKPDENSFVLVPLPASPAPTLYMYYPFPFCPTPVDPLGLACCLAKAATTVFPADALLFGVHPWTAVGTLSAILTTSTIGPLLGEVQANALLPLLSTLEASIVALVGLLQPIVIVSPCPAPLAVALVLYWIPLPYILYMKNNKPEIAIEVSRFSPTRDLGLWQFRERKITSGARARIRDGSMWNPHYRIEVTGVWDGEQI